ncbi:hypothetical protein [Spirillospora sp. CA-294931]|uniref:hypothetical protein n=1 Tax=Spirillospora sp. CA-294931 TaxID=3240042 RepID=UPI003D8CF124
MDVLLQEKTLVFGEKLGIVNANKQAYGLLSVVTGVLLSAAQGKNIEAAYLLLPYIILAFSYYILSNTLMFTLIAAHLEEIDRELHIIEAEINTRMWQAGVGGDTSRWGLVISTSRGPVLNPYVAQIVTIAILGLSITCYSMARAWLFLDDWKNATLANIYTTATATCILLFIAVSATVSRLAQTPNTLAPPPR